LLRTTAFAALALYIATPAAAGGDINPAKGALPAVSSANGKFDFTGGGLSVLLFQRRCLTGMGCKLMGWSAARTMAAFMAVAPICFGAIRARALSASAQA
jgi:hypothetical protein